MRYLLLNPGDTVRPGDEYWSESLGLWDSIGEPNIHWWGDDHRVPENGAPVRRAHRKLGFHAVSGE